MIDPMPTLAYLDATQAILEQIRAAAGEKAFVCGTA